MGKNKPPTAISAKAEVEIWRKPHNELAVPDFLFDFNTTYGLISHRLAVKNYFWFYQNRKNRRASLNVKRDRNGRQKRYLAQEIAKKTIN